MLKNLCWLGMFLVCFSAASAAPTLENHQSGFKDWLGGNTRSSLGLIDPSRLSVQHNIAFGMASGGGQSVMQSLYATRFRYQLSNPLVLTFQLGVMNNRFGGRNLAGNFNSLISGVRLDYSPSINFHINVELLQGPVYSWPGVYNQHRWAVSSNE